MFSPDHLCSNIIGPGGPVMHAQVVQPDGPAGLLMSGPLVPALTDPSSPSGQLRHCSEQTFKAFTYTIRQLINILPVLVEMPSMEQKMKAKTAIYIVQKLAKFNHSICKRRTGNEIIYSPHNSRLQKSPRFTGSHTLYGTSILRISKSLQRVKRKT